MALYSYNQLHNANGTRLVRSLFKEGQYSEKHNIFTLDKRDNPNEGLTSLWRLYMQFAVDDPTEYSFAVEVFGDMAFWLNLRDKYPIKDCIEDWETEAEVARKSKALAFIRDATLDPKTSFQAAKYLLENGSKARPSFATMDKRKVRKHDKEQIAGILEKKEFAEDLDRLSEFFNDSTTLN